MRECGYREEVGGRSYLSAPFPFILLLTNLPLPCQFLPRSTLQPPFLWRGMPNYCIERHSPSLDFLL